MSRVARAWQPGRYLKFEAPRLRPALDLVGQIGHEGPGCVVDLGCGVGNITGVLRSRWPETKVVCVDSSSAMLEKARERHEAEGIAGVTYVKADFEEFEPDGPVDVIYSNAALHWVGFGVHKALLPKLMSFLRPGGVLAFQMPDTRQQDSHLLMQTAAQELGFSKKLEGVRWVTAEGSLAAYHELLAPYCSPDPDGLNMWTTTYAHLLSGENPVADFTASTGLGPYVDALGGSSSTDGALFTARYRALILEKYPKLPDQRTLFEMKRFFVVAQKAA